MSHLVINAISIRPGGGLRVVAGLLARFNERNRFTVWVSDPQSREVLNATVGARSNITYADPIGSVSNLAAFEWGMRRMSGDLAEAGADAVLGVNHAYPSGGVPQVIYHLNVHRFARSAQPIWTGSEVAERLRDWRSAAAIRKASANVFESYQLLDVALSRHRRINRPRVVHIGLDDREPFPAAPSETAWNSSDILVLTSPQPHKDNPVLIHMLMHLMRIAPQRAWRLRIAGGRTPNAFDDLRRLADQVGVLNRIEWLGFADHRTLRQIGEQSLCLVSASRVESFCMVALEAMSWGCPVVVADASSMPESVGDAGLMATPGDARSFADKVLLMANDRAVWMRYAQAGLQRARMTTWSSAAHAFETIFEDVIDNTVETV